MFVHLMKLLKGGMTMSMRKKLGIAVLAAAFGAALAGGIIWAIEPPQAPDWSKVQGPELWGVAIVHCGGGDNFGVMRVKRIQDCDVQTQAEVLNMGAVSQCVDDKDEYLYQKFPGVTLFDIPASTGDPIITKVKNFKYQTDGTNTVVSFDAQIKFVQP